MVEHDLADRALRLPVVLAYLGGRVDLQRQTARQGREEKNEKKRRANDGQMGCKRDGFAKKKGVPFFLPSDWVVGMAASPTTCAVTCAADAAAGRHRTNVSSNRSTDVIDLGRQEQRCADRPCCWGTRNATLYRGKQAGTPRSHEADVRFNEPPPPARTIDTAVRTHTPTHTSTHPPLRCQFRAPRRRRSSTTTW